MTASTNIRQRCERAPKLLVCDPRSGTTDTTQGLPKKGSSFGVKHSDEKTNCNFPCAIQTLLHLCHSHGTALLHHARCDEVQRTCATHAGEGHARHTWYLRHCRDAGHVGHTWHRDTWSPDRSCGRRKYRSYTWGRFWHGNPGAGSTRHRSSLRSLCGNAVRCGSTIWGSCC